MIYIIGAGFMAEEYLHTLDKLGLEASVVTRSAESAQRIKNAFNVDCALGGYQKFQISPGFQDVAIICTPIELLADCAAHLVTLGFKRILLEKPGALEPHQLVALKRAAFDKQCNISIAYNRRFFASVMHLRKLLAAEELLAVDFEISEWTHRINLDDYSEIALSRWFLSNTSHVADLVFDIAGKPDELSCYSSGSLAWHETGSRFSGSGVTANKVLISYKGYWDGPGRWSVEFVTSENRYYLRPMEKLYCQRKGSTDILEVPDVDYHDDEIAKPGLKKMLEHFFSGEYQVLCSLDDQIMNFPTYCQMANYV